MDTDDEATDMPGKPCGATPRDRGPTPWPAHPRSRGGPGAGMGEPSTRGVGGSPLLEVQRPIRSSLIAATNAATSTRNVGPAAFLLSRSRPRLPATSTHCDPDWL